MTDPNANSLDRARECTATDAREDELREQDRLVHQRAMRRALFELGRSSGARR